MRRFHLKLAAVAIWVAIAVSYALFDVRFNFANSETDALASVAPKVSSSVRVCTWNLKNYGVTKRFAGGKWREHPKPESERAAIGNILKLIDADVVVLEEIQDKAFLMDLRNRLHSIGISYKFWAIGENEAPMRVAILSKIEPDKFLDFSFIPFYFGGEKRASPRGTVGARFSSNNVKWSVYGFHLKSKFGSKKSDLSFEPFRAAELKAAFSRINTSMPTVLCGDFNDEPSAILKILSRYKFRYIEQADSSGFSHSYIWAKKNAKFVYDCFYANNLIMPYIKGKARVYESEKTTASDHRPVYLDLDFSGAGGKN